MDGLFRRHGEAGYKHCEAAKIRVSVHNMLWRKLKMPGLSDKNEQLKRNREKSDWKLLSANHFFLYNENCLLM